jgi:hypothetical protein
MRLTPFVVSTLSAFLISAAAYAQAPAGTSAVCKDGTYSSAASKRGACSGHKGVGQWLSGNQGAPTAAPASAPARPSAPTPADAPMKQNPMATAPQGAGGTGQVWVNTKSKVYHCQGDRYYGKTKAGSYMTEASAIAAGDRPDHGKACH